MYNANIPKENELPSSKQLIKSTVIALATALLLLATVILPAEYGVDPTGVGEVLGLTQMGEIKEQLAKEAEQDVQQLASEESNTDAKTIENELPVETIVAEVTSSEVIPAEATPSDTRSVQLKPGEAAEIKLAMKEGAVIVYEWSVNSGHVNFDTHGDGEGIKYFGYDKGKAFTEDKGELQAAFDGKHGWFWRNRSNETVTVNLKVSGDYGEIYRVL